MRRPLFIVGAAPWEDRCEGNRLELRLRGTTVFDEEALMRVLGVPLGKGERLVMREADTSTSAGTGMRTGKRKSGSGGTNGSVIAMPSGLSSECSAVFSATSTRPQHSDDLCSKTGLTAALVQEALLTLTLHAVLVEGPSGWFRRLS